ncbi:MAG: protein-glutamate O-methyltransferase CheR, partial [Myxococcaceae bacterium]
MRVLERSHFVSDDVDTIAQVLKRAAGITFNRGLVGTLNAAYQAASADLGIDPATCLRRLTAGEPEAVAAFVERAVVSETYFFRQAEHFQLLTSMMIGALGHPSPLRIWSAGCATGEESYSAAIALLGAGRLGDRIVATDISRTALARAQAGRFAAWSFRRMDPKLRARFFQEEGTGWRLSAPVRRAVQFSQHNLVTEPPPANDFHVVFCRNVLIYFEGEQLRKVLQSLVSALVPGGFLVVAVPELPLVAELPVERVEHEGVVVYRKVEKVRTADAPKRPVAAARSSPRRALTPVPRTAVIQKG